MASSTAELRSRAAPHGADGARLLVAKVDHVATIEMAEPERRNALSLAMLDALSASLTTAITDTATRAIVLSAQGPAFCAGHDLKELSSHRADSDNGRAFFETTFGLCADLMQLIANSPKPVIAAVEGIATAAGCQIVASCDLAVAGDHARFCTPGVQIGLFCATPMVALSRAVSRHHALEMLLLGEAVPASEAYRFGLVNRVVPAGTALAAALDLARRIALVSPGAVTTGKAAFAKQSGLPLDEAYKAMSAVMVENLLQADAREGISAFLDKRKPHWTAT